ncbi:MAG: SCO0930 family lipoprotein [Stackebrandtia sp.]
MRKTLLRRIALPAVLASLVLPALAACNTAGATDSKDDSKAKSEVKVGETDLGNVLVDSEGQTLYMFKKDKNGKSACYDDCEKKWPPLTVDGDPEAGEGAEADLLGTTEREDGTKQVTYKDMPLYYFAKDSASGDVKGQGVKDVWYVVDADGKVVETKGGSKKDDAKADIELSETDEYGEVLVDSEGMTLYMFFKDENLDNASACYGDCLKKWTPMTVEDEPTVGEGPAKGLVDTIEREDGSKQVTYNDWPMYTFNEDSEPGDLKGVGFKDLWCATDAAGDAAKQ